MCTCINDIQEMLQKKGFGRASLKIDYYESYSKNGKATSVLQVPFRYNEKRVNGTGFSQGGKIVTVAATHCPFCGEALK